MQISLHTHTVAHQIQIPVSHSGVLYLLVLILYAHCLTGREFTSDVKIERWMEVWRRKTRAKIHRGSSLAFVTRDKIIKIWRKGRKRITEAPILFCETAGQYLEWSPFPPRTSYSKHSRKTPEGKTWAVRTPRLAKPPGLKGFRVSLWGWQTEGWNVTLPKKKKKSSSIFSYKRGEKLFCVESRGEGTCGGASRRHWPTPGQALAAVTYSENQPD